MLHSFIFLQNYSVQWSKNMSNFVLWCKFEENIFSRNGVEKQVSEIWHQQNIQIESYCSNNCTDNCFAKMSLPPLQHQYFYKQRFNQTHIPLHSATFIPTFGKAIIQQNLVKSAREVNAQFPLHMLCNKINKACPFSQQICDGIMSKH